jgi:hypothetical protein
MGLYVQIGGASFEEKCNGLLDLGAKEFERHEKILFNLLIGLPKNIPICVVDNGRFAAAAVGFNSDEIKLFSNTEDYRPKRWFMIEYDLLKLHMGDELDKYLNN